MVYMKGFIKSLFSYSLAITFFGFKQLDKMMSSSASNGRKPPAIKSFDTLTSATIAHLGETLADSFHAVDSLQRGAVELLFDVLLPFASSQARPSRTFSEHSRVTEPQRWTECVEPLTVIGTPEPEPAFFNGRPD
jgi:hypothetical protein